jgi:hypothetical protein
LIVAQFDLVLKAHSILEHAQHFTKLDDAPAPDAAPDPYTGPGAGSAFCKYATPNGQACLANPTAAVILIRDPTQKGTQNIPTGDHEFMACLSGTI